MITLYRNGKTHHVRGFDCEAQNFNVKQLNECLANGWRTTPNPTIEDVDTNDSGKLSNEEIRAAAKEAGLDNWEKGRIKTLTKALGL